MNMLIGLVNRFNNDPKGGFHVKRFDFDWEHAGYSGISIEARPRINYRVSVQGTRRSGPYDNIIFTVESNDEQDLLDRVEALLEAAAK